jgi:signal transduction histidine kinase
LHVRLWAYPNSRGGLGELRLGPEAELHPEYERRYFLQTILPQLCNIVVAAFGVFAFALWVKQREAMYVLFSVFAVLWAVRSIHSFARDIPVSTFYWDIWVQSSFGWCALLFIVLAIRMSELRWPRFERLLFVYALSGPLLMYFAGPQHLHKAANNWSFVIVPVAMVFEGFLIREAWRRRTLVSAVFAGVWALMIAASVHDGLVHRDRLAFDSFYLVSYVMILLALVIGWMLTHRFVAALRQAERLNLELEQRVAQKHSELEQNFERLQEMERRTAVAEERRRLMSEMHDGIGSQLIATLDSIERGEAINNAAVASELRECLDHLRLTIDSLEPTENDLLTVLGNLRYRLAGRLRRSGIALHWQVQDLPPLSSLTPQNVLHVLRILQEAFTNIIKHAAARSITVRTGFDDGHVYIAVADDGRGFSLDSGRTGRGLLNMRRRARELGGALEVCSGASGTSLTLRLGRTAGAATVVNNPPLEELA